MKTAVMGSLKLHIMPQVVIERRVYHSVLCLGVGTTLIQKIVSLICLAKLWRHC